MADHDPETDFNTEDVESVIKSALVTVFAEATFDSEKITPWTNQVLEIILVRRRGGAARGAGSALTRAFPARTIPLPHPSSFARAPRRRASIAWARTTST